MQEEEGISIRLTHSNVFLVWLPASVIYQCKANSINMNLTKNQYFITKLLAGMKKDWGSWGGCGGKEALESSMGKTG